MTRTMLPEGAALTGAEQFFGVQDGKWRRFASSMFSTMLLSSDDLKTQVNALIDTRGTTIPKVSGLQSALDAKQPLMKFPTFAGLTNASGVATISFTGVTSVSYVDVIDDWSAQQMITGKVLTASPAGCTVQVMRSKGTLLLAAGPFETAPAGISVTVRVVGT